MLPLSKDWFSFGLVFTMIRHNAQGSLSLSRSLDDDIDYDMKTKYFCIQ